MAESPLILERLKNKDVLEVLRLEARIGVIVCQEEEKEDMCGVMGKRAGGNQGQECVVLLIYIHNC